MPPSRSFVFYNNKGGVGKTSITFNFATELACRLPKHKVIMLDLDGQCNLSALALGGGILAQELVLSRMQERRDIQHYLMRRIQSHGTGPALNDPHFCANVQMVTSTWDLRNGAREEHVPSNLFLVSGASSIDLFASEVEKLAQEQPGMINPVPFRSTYNLLRDPISKLDESWIVVVDTNPSFTIISRLALVGCQELIIPTTLDELATGGVRNLLFQLGVKEIMSNSAGHPAVANNIKEYLDSKQSAEEQNALSNNHEILIPRVTPARIRCLVLNRVARSNERRANAVKRMIEILNNMMKKALTLHPDLFAEPYYDLPAGITVEERFRMCHLVEVCDVKASMVVSQNLGIALGQGQRKRYYMNLPDFYELYDDTDGQAATVHFDAQDQVRYALAVQDLVEICLESDHRPELCLLGTLKTARSNPEASIIEVVRPRTQDSSSSLGASYPVAEGIILGEHGRRLLPVERNTNMFTTLTPGTRSGVSTDITSIAMELLEEAKWMNSSPPPSAVPTVQRSEIHESTKKKTPTSSALQKSATSSAGKQVKVTALRDTLDENNEGGDGSADSGVKPKKKKKKKRRSSKGSITTHDQNGNDEAQQAGTAEHEVVNKPKRKRLTSLKKATTVTAASSNAVGDDLPQLRLNEETQLKAMDET